MVRVKVSFDMKTEESRMVCDSIDRAKGNPILEEALERQLCIYMRNGLAALRSHSGIEQRK